MWIDDQADLETVKTWVKHCPAMKLVATIDGKILWANAAFLEWSQYTLAELTKISWIQLSVADENLEYDMASAKMLDVYTPMYRVKKQYIPKGSAPEWGILNVMRYPMNGEIKWCLCTWEPMKDSSSAAFKQAMDSNEKIQQRITEMTEVLKVITAQTDEDRYVISTIRLVQKYPKAAAMVLIFAAGILGLNNLLEFFQRTGLSEIPIRVEPKAESDSVGISVPIHNADMVRLY